MMMPFGMMQQQQVTCDVCKGKGKYIDLKDPGSVCTKCKGEGSLEEEVTVSLEYEGGVALKFNSNNRNDNSEIREEEEEEIEEEIVMGEMGDYVRNTEGDNGNLVLTVRENKGKITLVENDNINNNNNNNNNK
jgi:DnaJ-class molecular chaperone